MATIVHYTPVGTPLSCNIHIWQSAWDGNLVLDAAGASNHGVFDFQLPDVADPRTLQFLFHSISSTDAWETNAFVRRLALPSPTEIWTFAASPRILYQNPFPAGVAFNGGDVLTIHLITQSAFRGGQIYVWDPYGSNNNPLYFNQTSRDEANGVSTFQITLTNWMTSGFNFKVLQPNGSDGKALWEPDASNRVWRPCDGNSIWLKSGQCDVRSSPLTLTPVALEVLYPAQLTAPPRLTLQDLAENLSYPVVATSSQSYAGSALCRVASYSVPIYPGAAYSLSSPSNLESSAIDRPFPADPTALNTVSRFALGASDWLAAFPTFQSILLSIAPQNPSSFAGGVTVQACIGNGPVFDTQAAPLQPNGLYEATLSLALETTCSIRLVPAAGFEPKPYAQLDTSRYFTPATTTTRLYTTEGIYGVCARGGTQFADPPSRNALMQAAFSPAIASAGIFAPREMPHGATIANGDVYFVVHAPHSVCTTLILVNMNAVGGPARLQVPMMLSTDSIYWWCRVPLAQAPQGTRYRFLLNDNIEVLDPAARAVLDRKQLETNPGDDPATPSTSWSLVLDAATVKANAHRQLWQTMGWQDLLIYELHAARFTNLDVSGRASLDVLTDELQPTSRLRKPGYLRQLPVTAFELLPVAEFNSAAGWGYNPSYYFAIDEFYGGADAMARFVNAAHTNGRAVMFDLVYNHSNSSSLMRIASDVYRAGDSWGGDAMNCGHPMTSEFLRQATVYLFDTFNLDGFRFDDTQSIVSHPQGWEFLSGIRFALRGAAGVSGRAWPYCVAENYATVQWDISNPSYGVMDAQWGIDESYRIEDASYDAWHNGWDDSGRLTNEMNNPSYWGRPFSQAVRFGESHDIVSLQDQPQKDRRIAARPPPGQGYQLAKAFGALTLLSNGIPMLFMGQEVGETATFFVNASDQFLNPQLHDLPDASATDNTRVLAWFRLLMGLRNDPSKGLQGQSNYQVVATGNRTVAFTCGFNQSLFVIFTFGTPDQHQNSGWLGLPGGSPYKEIFNSSWPVFQVEFEPEYANGGYDAQIYSGQILNLPYMGAVVLERR